MGHHVAVSARPAHPQEKAMGRQSVCHLVDWVETPKTENPSRLNELGLCMEPKRTSGDAL